MTAETLALAEPDSAEELERAELYGVLARCWHAPPDAALFGQFAVAVTQAAEPGSFLEAPWQDLDRKSTRLNSSHVLRSRMPSSA